MSTLKIQKFAVKKQTFLDWYFSDNDDTLEIGHKAINSLNKEGKFSISIQDLLDSCCEIPPYILIGCEENLFDDWVSPASIRLID